DLVNYDEFLLFYLRSKCRLQGCSLLFLVHLERVISRNRSEYNSAACPLRSSCGSLSCMTGSFLSPRFSSAAGNFRTCLCLLCSLTIICQLVYDCHVYQMLVYLNTEYRIA